MGEATRAFLALTLPVVAVEAAAETLEQLRPRSGRGDVKWVDSGNLHITLRFFGNLDGEQRERASACVRSLHKTFAPVATMWGALGAFPSARRVQVVWLGLEDESGKLTALAREVNHGLIRQGFGRPDKPFKAHVTLGRVRRGRSVSWDVLSDRLTIPRAAFSISNIVLMKSVLTPQGPVYTPLETATARGLHD